MEGETYRLLVQLFEGSTDFAFPVGQIIGSGHEVVNNPLTVNVVCDLL